MATATILQGAEGFIFKADRAGRVAAKQNMNPQRCRINTTTTAEVVEIEERGCGEFAHKRYVFRVEGKLVSIHERNVKG